MDTVAIDDFQRNPHCKLDFCTMEGTCGETPPSHRHEDRPEGRAASAAGAARRRVALLVDADNIAPRLASQAHVLASFEGEVAAFRAYGSEAVLATGEWKALEREKGAERIVCNNVFPAKNSADIYLVMDAMDLLAQDSCEAFAITSDDSDFIPLARRLRRSGKTVVALCCRKRTSAYRNEFDAYHILGNGLGETAKADSESEETATRNADLHPSLTGPALVGLLVRCSQEAADEAGWCTMSKLSELVRKKRPTFSPKAYGFKTMKKLVLGTKAFEHRQSRDDFLIRAKTRIA